MSNSLKCVASPRSHFVYLGKARLTFPEMDSSVAEIASREPQAAGRAGLRRYIVDYLKAHPELLGRFTETEMTFEYRIEESTAYCGAAVVMVSVWLEPALVEWDVVGLNTEQPPDAPALGN